MMVSEQEGILRVLETYVAVLSRIGGAVAYLFYLTAGLLGGWVTSLAFIFLRPLWLAFAATAASFILVFALAIYSTGTLLRLQEAYAIQKMPPEERASTLRRWRRSSLVIWIGWLALFILAFPMAALYAWPVSVPVAVSLSVGLGNLLVYAVARLGYGRRDLRPLLVALYLLATTPTYFYLPKMAPIPYFILLSVHLAIPYFAAAVSYSLAAKKRVAEVLHAAR